MQTSTRRFSLLTVVFIVVLSLTASAEPVHLRCEYLVNPLGIDAPAPHLSWQSDNTERNWEQSAYRILVASTPERLAAGDADIWDSGRTSSSESVNIPYAGPTLESRRRYYWRVIAWDVAGQSSESAEQAWWEMGLLHTSDWKAQWIHWNNPENDADRAAMHWIWVAGQDALATPEKTTAVFRTDLKIYDKPRDAALLIAVRGGFVASVNGHDVGRKSGWNAFDRIDITDQLVIGKNLIEVTVVAPSVDDSTPKKTTTAGLTGLIKLTSGSGSVVRIPADQRWQAQLAHENSWRDAQIAADLSDERFGDPGPLPQPAADMRRAFEITKQIRRARIFASALGSYRMFLNGKPVSTDLLTPDFTDYRKRVLYQTYDVTALVHAGKNAASAILGDGWFGSALTWAGTHVFSGPDRLLAQLELDYTDGSRETIATDNAWKTASSAIFRSDLYAGEVYDARAEKAGWQDASFNDSAWNSATASDAPPIAVSSRISSPPQIVKTLTPRSVKAGPSGTYVFDMGQNMVGWATLHVKGAAGTRVRLRFAEVLNSDGTIYTANLRNADATDTYVLRGGSEETFSPHFTFHGFRYVEVTGYPETPAIGAITGDVVSSLSGDPVATLYTSSDLVNRMWSIGIWGQRGNFLSVPTDCPQRDERLGWMGDAGVFWRTGTYNFDTATFSRKFIQDIVDAQARDGAFSNVSPNVLSADDVGAPGWGDAGIIIPWTTWMQYGDKAVVRQHWQAMQKWMEFIESRNPGYLRKQGLGPNYADWLAPDENTNKELLATAYWALVANMMSEMARAIGNDSDGRRYDELVQNIRSAFQKEYIKEDGHVGTGTQTSYVVALYTKMAPTSLEPKLVERLVADIESRQWHLSTGFLGTPFLLFALADHGRSDVAYRLLLNETYPSWGYMLSKGATTWWERWNGDSGDPSMNSYNHYAFGSVIAWVYRYAAGIETTPEAPGFKEIVIHPHLDSRMTSARAEYDSVYGRIVSDWKGTAQGTFSLNITIPANTSGRVFLPVIPGARITEDGKVIDAQPANGSYIVPVRSGSYHFEVK